MSRDENRNYLITCLLPIEKEEQAVDEFVQKLSAEIGNAGGKLSEHKKTRQTMVKTSQRPNSRHVHMVVIKSELPASAVKAVNRYLLLARGVVLNHSILRQATPLAV